MKYPPVYTFIIGLSSIVLFGLMVLLIAPFQALFQWRWPTQGRIIPFAMKIRRLWACLMLKAHGVRWVCRGPGLDQMRQARGVIFVSNHQSALDILIHAVSLPIDTLFLAKKELLMMPIFGWAAWLAGTTFIDRAKGIQDERSLARVQNSLQNGLSIVVYPEGTRSSDGNLLAFKRGAFVLAIKTGVALIPVVLKGTARLMPKKSLRIHSGTVEVWFGEPISVDSKSHEDRYELAEQVRQLMQAELERASHPEA